MLVRPPPLALPQLSKLLDPPLEPDFVRKLLDELHADWAERSVELVQIASGWRFAPDCVPSWVTTLLAG